MDNYFNISDFNISGKPIPEDVADKILKYHILPLNKVRAHLGIPIWPSEKSGYRPLWWEKARGRSGNSQHVFRGHGAVDLTCKDFQENKGVLLESVIKLTNYNRICIYENFLHLDYAGIERWVYEDGQDGWMRLFKIDEENNQHLQD